jgi:hypothetical protein
VHCALHTPFHTATPQCGDFCGLLWKQAQTWCTYTSNTESWWGFLVLQKHSFCLNVLH